MKSQNSFKSTSNTYKNFNPKERNDDDFLSSSSNFQSNKKENVNDDLPPTVQLDSDIQDPIVEITNWDEFDIKPDLLRGIYSYGFEKPSPIQSRAINPILMKRDVIAQAQSGTGKSGAFTVAALNEIDLNEKNVQALLLSPTRELATQTSIFVSKLGCMMNGLSVQTLIGGSYIDDDIRIFKNTSPQILVGCPGRVHDMMRRNVFNPKKIRLIIIDEADEMLSSGFKDQLYNIFKYLNSTVQVALFSATLPENIYEITNKFMRNPVKISVKAENLTLEGISQFFVALDNDQQKYSTLKDLYSYFSFSQSIIYCNSVKRVIDLHLAMSEDGFPVCCIHSNMEKFERDEAMAEFRNGKYRVMISSNVTARGIDVQQVGIVMNFDIPKCVHTYLHRIGRSGRWGRKGVSINFITRRDVSYMKDIETHYQCDIKELPSDLNNIMK